LSIDQERKEGINPSAKERERKKKKGQCSVWTGSYFPDNKYKTCEKNLKK
jgi:hypothetical protein